MRRLALFAGAFSAAVLLWRFSLWPLALAAALACCLGGLFLGRRHPSARQAGLLLFCGAAAALVWSTGFYRLTLAPWEGCHREKDVPLTARVDGFGYQGRNGRWVVPVRLTDPADGKRVDGSLYLFPDTELLPGDILNLTGTVYLADWIGEEESTYFSSKGIFVRVYVDELLSHSRPEELSPRYWPQYAARYTEALLTRFFAEDTAPLARALVTGSKEGLDEHFQAMSRRAGLAHVIVISGMHVSFLSSAIALFLGRRNRFSAAVTLLLLGFFALMAGGTPSAWRAVLLCGAGLLAPLLGRENDPPTSLLAALMLLLLRNPYAAASISLQLSFAAVAGIYLLTPALLERWKPRGKRPAKPVGRILRRLRHALVSTLSVSLGAIAFTTPLSAWYFGTVSLIAPLSNLLALWAVSDAFLLSVAAAVTGLFAPPLAAGLAWAGNWFLRYLTAVTNTLGALPFASITLTSVYYAVGLAGVYGILCLHLLWPGKGKRLRPPLLCSLLLLACCALFTRLEFRAGDLTVAVLDVGQGQAVLLRGGGATILVDCGGDGYTDAGNTAADYLADVGVERLDLLVLTHYHADHANGVASLLRRVEVTAAALPDVEPESELRQAVLAQLDRAGTDITYVTENLRYTLDEDTVLTLYAPLGTGGGNEEGLSVLMSTGSYDALITGDMNAEVEGRLVKYGGLPDIELLVVGHHGSRYSTGETLLDTLRPETAVISVGAGNSYGHPAEETLQRLAGREITIYRTDLAGTVVLHTSGKE